MSTNRLLSQFLTLGLTLCVSGTTASVAATATTDPVGYNTISLLANSDTYVSVPFHRPTAFVGQVSSVSGNVITVAGSPGWTMSQFVYASGTQSNTYYAFIRSGTKEGNYYTVTANASNTLTLDLAGDTLAGLTSNDSISVIPYWTLGTLFPASDAGVSFTASALSFSPKTMVLLPDLQSSGINNAPSATHFFYSGAWRRFGQPNVSTNEEILFPDSYFIVRNGAEGGTLTSAGSVSMKKISSPIVTRANSKQDNPVALQRPIPVSLSDSGLVTSGAFSPSSLSFAPGDLLYVYDNTAAGRNKSPSATYFYYNNAWRRFGRPDTENHGSTLVFGPTTAVLIRKAATANGATATWVNTATY